MQHGSASFSAALSQLRDAVNDVFKSRRVLPTFLLLYTSIDILASLTRPKDSESTSSKYFKDWVAAYMLPESNLPCTAHDIWGARCGLLHTLTAESDMSRLKSARMINYIGDIHYAEEMQQRHDAGATKDLFVSTHLFVKAFIAACNRFDSAVRSDTHLQDTVYFHAAKLVVEIK